MGFLKQIKGLGKKAQRFGRGLGKKITKEGFLSDAHRSLGRFNTFAIPALTAASGLPYVGGVAATGAKLLGAAQTGLGVASKVQQMQKAFTPSMGKSVGNSTSVESFHTPNIGAVRGANKEKEMLQALGSKFDPSSVSMEEIMGISSKNIGRQIRQHIQNLGDESRMTDSGGIRKERKTPSKTF